MKALYRPVYLIGLLVAGIGTAAAVDRDMKVVDVGAGYIMGGIYTSPYGVEVDGVRTLLICDDFEYNIPSIPYEWTAVEFTLTDLRNGNNPPGTPKFVPGVPVPEEVLLNYTIAAVLAGKLMSQSNFATPVAGYLSYAIWAVFSANALNSLTPSQRYQAEAELALATAIAVAAIGSGDFSSIPELMIYTPLSPPGPDSQEFFRVISMPEPSSVALIIVDLMGVAALVLFFRRRQITAAAN